MSTITSGLMPANLLPPLGKWFGEEYNKIPEQYKEVFMEEASSRAFEEDTAWSSLGLAKVKNEGSAYEEDTIRQLYTTQYLHVAYALGMRITKEAMDDGQTIKVAQQQARMLARAVAQTRNTVAANILNRAFTAAYSGGDGKELCATDHTTTGQGANGRNELSTAADLSETSLEQSILDIQDMRDDRGLRAFLRPKKLIIPTELQFEAHRILNSTGRVGVADNDTNAIREMLAVPGGYAKMDYLTDSDAFFITTDAPNGLKHMNRTAPEMHEDKDHSTLDMRFMVYYRDSFGWSDWRGIFGSPGAA